MTPEERAARERKQKIFVVVGGVFLLGLVALQLPKLLGGSGQASAVPAPAPAQQTAQPGSTATPTPVALTGARASVQTGSGKLTTFGPFRAKNPFVQLVVAEPAQTGDAAAKGEGGARGGTEGGGSKGFSIDGDPTAPSVTIVSVNGVRQTVEPGTRFPASDPVFVLVAEQPGSKAVLVGVVGGAYAGGTKTTKLRVGKQLMLVNTATGAKYKLKLVSVGSGDAAPQRGDEKK